MKNLFRIFLNFVITGLLIIFFNILGWINIIEPPTLIDQPKLNLLLIGIIIGLQMLIIGEIFEFVYFIAKLATFGFAKLLYPIFFIIVGYLKLIIPMFYLLNWYKPTFDFLPVLLMSVAVGLVRIPKWVIEKKD